MKLYAMLASPNSRKPLVVIKHLNLDVEIREMDIQKGELNAPEFLAVNPNGMVPAFEDGDLKLWESNAIAQYLAATAPANDLFPENAKARADISRWQCWELAHFGQAAGTLIFENLIKPVFHGEPGDAAAIERATQSFGQFAAVLDAQLAGRSFLTGDKFTLADISVASPLGFAGPAKMPLENYSNIAAWLKRLDEIPAWAETAPKLG